MKLPVTAVRVSSTLAAGAEFSFEKEQLTDGRLDTCWQAASAKGEWIELEFDPPVTLTSVRIANGFQQEHPLYGDLFDKNSRIHKAKLVFSCGKSLSIVFEPNEKGMKEFKLSPVSTRSLLLRIDAIHKGTRWNDLAVAEIEAWGHSMPGIEPPPDFPNEAFGVVSVGKASVHARPDDKSPVLTTFRFATPIHVKKGLAVSPISSPKQIFWYREQSTGGWILSEQLILTPYHKGELVTLVPESIRCHVICGGASCSWAFKPILIGDRTYIYPAYFNDYGPPDLPHGGYVIGRYRRVGSKFEFYKTIQIGAYNGGGVWVTDLPKALGQEQYKAWFSSRQPRVLNPHKDAEGVYYLIEKAEYNDGRTVSIDGQRSRQELRRMCLQPYDKLRREVWVVAFTKRSVSLREIQILMSFPP